MYYLCKFCKDGKLETSIPSTLFNNYGGEEKLLQDGYIKITTDDYQYYVGNKGNGDNRTGYVRDSITGKPISAPAIPKEDLQEQERQSLDAEYAVKFAEKDNEIIKAVVIMQDTEYAQQLRQERTALVQEYADKRSAL